MNSYQTMMAIQFAKRDYTKRFPHRKKPNTATSYCTIEDESVILRDEDGNNVLIDKVLPIGVSKIKDKTEIYFSTDIQDRRDAKWLENLHDYAELQSKGK